jgi:hypothetical protein
MECTPPKKKIYLHIGHGKTGTSSIQSVLARAEADLKKANILYPYAPGAEDAKRGFVTSGNIPLQSIEANWVEYCLDVVTRRSPGYSVYVFSSEIVFWCMDQFYSALEACRDHFDFEVVLTVRDSFDMFSSAYQQYVKGCGIAMSFADFLQQEHYLESHAPQAVAILDKLEELKARVHLLNYTAIGTSIGARVLAAMGISELTCAHISECRIVNRSLDPAELQLMLLVNFLFGAEVGVRISYALINGLPNLPSIKLPFSEDSAVVIKDNMQPFVDEINRRLPEGEQLSLKPSTFCAEAPRSDLLNSDQAAIAYGELVNWSKEVLAFPSFSSDKLIPVAHLILLFFLGSASCSQIPVNRQTLSIITEECQGANCYSGLCEVFNNNQLLSYLGYFSDGDSAVLPAYILISQKLNALTHAGLTPAEILDLFAIVHRVKLRVAVA